MKFKDIRVLFKEKFQMWMGRDFVIRKAQVVSDDSDISIFVSGHMVWNAIKAEIFLENIRLNSSILMQPKKLFKRKQ